MSDYISEDALIQILKYLPARNIVRLRSVCKSWKELIDSDELMLKHLALQKPSFLVEYGSTKFVAVELGCHPLTHTVKCPIQGISFSGSYGTHHGIVCFDNGDRNISLWNPSTGKHSSILLPVDFSFDEHCKNGWDCCKSFCIDPITKEYQIIILYFKEVEEEVHVTVNGILYSSVARDWSVIPEQEIERGWCFPSRIYLLVEGVAYWTDDIVEAVLSFDLSQKTLELIKLPSRKLTFDSPMSMHIERSKFGDPIQLIQWKGAFSVLCRAPNSRDTFEIQTRVEGSWMSMFRFKIPSPEPPVFVLALAERDEGFWVLYDTYNDMMRKQSKQRDQGKLKGGWKFYHDLYVYESGVGCTRLTSGDRNPISHDFVETLLFPNP